MAGQWVSLIGKQWVSQHDPINSFPWTTNAGAGRAGIQMLARDVDTATPDFVSLTKIRFSATVKPKAYVGPGTKVFFSYGTVARQFNLSQGTTTTCTVAETDTGAVSPQGLQLTLDGNQNETTDVEFKVTQFELGDGLGAWYNVLTGRWSTHNARRNILLPYSFNLGTKFDRPGVVLPDSAFLSVLGPGQKPTAIRAAGRIQMRAGQVAGGDEYYVNYGDFLHVGVLQVNTEWAIETAVPDDTVFNLEIGTDRSVSDFNYARFTITRIDVFVEDPPPVPPPPGVFKGPTASFRHEGPTQLPAGSEFPARFIDQSIAGTYPIVKWEWILGNTPYNGQNPPVQVLFPDTSPYSYSVYLRVTDDHGNVSSTIAGTLWLTVVYPPPPPPGPPPQYTDPNPEAMGPAPPLPPKPPGSEGDVEIGPPLGVESTFGAQASGLFKLGEVVVTQRGIASKQPIPPDTHMHLWGAPLPYGMQYNWETAPVTEFIAIPPGSTVYIPPGATLVHNASGLVTGYFITKPGKRVITSPGQFSSWSQINASVGPGWFAMPQGMTPVLFPDYPQAPNGYPKPGHNGPIWGFIDHSHPTRGYVREWRTYYRASQGAPWMPSAYSDPPFCITRFAVMMQSNFPGYPGKGGTAVQRTRDNKHGWNAGAESVDEFDGNTRLTFKASIVNGAVVGIGPERADNTDFRKITHAIYFTRSGDNTIFAQIMENGRVVSTIGAAFDDDTFVIERIDGLVEYRLNGDTIYNSLSKSFGPVRAGTVLYSAGEWVP